MLFVGTSIIHPSTEGVFLLCNILDLLIYSWEIRFLTVDGSDDMVRIRKEFLSENDFSNRDKINDLYVSIYFNWGDFGQCWFNGKWYGYDTICKIQRKNKDDNWQRYV